MCSFVCVDSTESAVAMGIILGLNLLYIFVVRKRIAFAAACLEIAVTATKAYPAMIFMGIVGILMLVRTAVRDIRNLRTDFHCATFSMHPRFVHALSDNAQSRVTQT